MPGIFLPTVNFLNARFFPFREVIPIPAALLTWVAMLFLL